MKKSHKNKRNKNKNKNITIKGKRKNKIKWNERNKKENKKGNLRSVGLARETGTGGLRLAIGRLLPSDRSDGKIPAHWHKWRSTSSTCASATSRLHDGRRPAQQGTSRAGLLRGRPAGWHGNILLLYCSLESRYKCTASTCTALPCGLQASSRYVNHVDLHTPLHCCIWCADRMMYICVRAGEVPGAPRRAAWRAAGGGGDVVRTTYGYGSATPKANDAEDGAVVKRWMLPFSSTCHKH